MNSLDCPHCGQTFGMEGMDTASVPKHVCKSCVFCNREGAQRKSDFVLGHNDDPGICSFHIEAILFSVMDNKPGWLETVIGVEEDNKLLDAAMKLALATLNGLNTTRVQDDLAQEVLHCIAEKGKE